MSVKVAESVFGYIVYLGLLANHKGLQIHSSESTTVRA